MTFDQFIVNIVKINVSDVSSQVIAVSKKFENGEITGRCWVNVEKEIETILINYYSFLLTLGCSSLPISLDQNCVHMNWEVDLLSS